MRKLLSILILLSTPVAVWAQPAGSVPADNESNAITITRVGAYLFCYDGSTWDRCPGNSTDGVLVNLGTNNDVTIQANASVDLNQIVGSAPGATNPLPARLSDGAAFVNPASESTLSARLAEATFTGRLPAGANPADDESNTVSITRIGSFLFCFDGSTWDRCPGDSTNGLTVNLGANNDVTVTGTVTANAGSNLNTSALALETSVDQLEGYVDQLEGYTDGIEAALTAIETAVEIMDDWDESDRLKANLIVGQAGIAGGTGADGATVPRVSLATDVPLPTGPNAIGKLAANTGVDIGDVDVTSSALPTGAATAANQLPDSHNVTVDGLPDEGQQTAANSISTTLDTDNDYVGATGAAPPGEAAYVGGLGSGATGGYLGGITVCDSHFNVDITTATTTLAVTGVSGRHVRICSIDLVTTAANCVALIAGTGATCGTSTAGMGGGTTAAEGQCFAANSGLTLGNGIGEVKSTKVSGGATGDSVCIVTSAATQLSGTISYTIY